jgi:hypothetical protein
MLVDRRVGIDRGCTRSSSGGNQYRLGDAIYTNREKRDHHVSGRRRAGGVYCQHSSERPKARIRTPNATAWQSKWRRKSYRTLKRRAREDEGIADPSAGVESIVGSFYSLSPGNRGECSINTKIMAMPLSSL